MTPAAPEPETAITRRDLLTLVGTAAAGQLLRSEDRQENRRALQENRARVFVGR